MYSFVYITCPNSEEAEKIAEFLVKERLLACANIISDMKSIYEWKGKVEKTSEVILIGKTQSKLIPEVEKKVAELHSYDCPCIVSWKLDRGVDSFLQWINRQIR